MDFVTKEEFLRLETEVKTMSHNVNILTSSVTAHVKTIELYMHKMDTYQDRLIGVVTNTTPDGHVPLQTHQQIVRSLIWAFTVIIAVTLGVLKFAPAILPMLMNTTN